MAKAKVKKAKDIKEAKKINPKLKKQIRLTISAILMITAIVIALIPPGDIEAGNATEREKVSRGIREDERKNAVYKINNWCESIERLVGVSNEPGDYINWRKRELNDILPNYPILKPFTANNMGTGGYIDQIFPAYNINNSTGEWELNVQFEFFLLNAEHHGARGSDIGGPIISRYNNRYPDPDVEFGAYITLDYYDVTTEQINKLYEELSEISESSNRFSLIFEEYRASLTGSESEGMIFFQRFRPDVYLRFKRASDDFIAYLETGPDPDIPEVLRPDDERFFTGALNFTDTEKIEYYCELLSDFPSINDQTFPFINAHMYILEEVIDMRGSMEGGATPVPSPDPSPEPSPDPSPEPSPDPSPEPSPDPSPEPSPDPNPEPSPEPSPDVIPVPSPSPGPIPGQQKIYVARERVPDRNNTNTDDNGFLITRRTNSVIGIGDNAFERVGNVETLTIPPIIKYIGDEAFQHSTMLERITFANVSNIGNRAFYNCTRLSDVNFGNNMKLIGTEAFFNTAIGADIRGNDIPLVLPVSISLIGKGAFANSRNLRVINLESITIPCEIDDFAFYNCNVLNNVLMDNPNISRIGIAAFALAQDRSDNGNWLSAYLPPSITGYTDASELGNYMFEGRTKLQYVRMPAAYGVFANGSYPVDTTTAAGTPTTVNAVKLPSGFFRNCSNLQELHFPANNGFVTFCDMIFYDTNHRDFIVRGPENRGGAGGGTALPRRATWKCFTNVSDFVTYIYEDQDNNKHYEISYGTFLFQADDRGGFTGVLLTEGNNFPFDPINPNYIDLPIPEMVGNISIKVITESVLADANLRSRLRTVNINKSIEEIGDNAFAGCNQLIEVTFQSPDDHGTLKRIGANAFRTGSARLVFRGDIVYGYEPFMYAMDPLRGDAGGKNILYQSILTDSNLTNLTAIYDNETEEVVLMNYPKLDTLDENNLDYLDYMEAEYTRIYADPRYDTLRDNFVNEYNRLKGLATSTPAPSPAEPSPDATPLPSPAEPDPDAASPPPPTPVSVESLDAIYNINSAYFGPWISRAFLNDPTDYGRRTVDYLIDPDMEPYYVYYENGIKQGGIHSYSIEKNYSNSNPQSDRPFERTTANEDALIYATKNIIIPAGITSIDAKRYLGSTSTVNGQNRIAYFDPESPRTPSFINLREYRMILNPNNDIDEEGNTIEGGLFSGGYKEFPDGSSFERLVKGNDRVERIFMSTVKNLPNFAFDSCERLEYIELGSSMEDIGTLPFRGCTSLRTVIGNNTYFSENGIIYSIKLDGTNLIEQVLPTRGILVGSGIIPDGSTEIDRIANVSEIAKAAFSGVRGLNLVILDEATNLTTIPEGCFQNSTGNIAISLPRTVRQILDNAFSNIEGGLTVTLKNANATIKDNAFSGSPGAIFETLQYDPNIDQSASDFRPDDPRNFSNNWLWAIGNTYVTPRPVSPSLMAYFYDYENPTDDDVSFIEAAPIINNSVVPLPHRGRAGHTADGWHTIPPVQEPFNRLTIDTHFIANYRSNLETDDRELIFFDTIGGNIIGRPYPVKVGDTVPVSEAPPAPVHSGYTFIGWQPNGPWVIGEGVLAPIAAMYRDTNETDSTPDPNVSPNPSPTGTPRPGTNEAGTFTVSVSGGSGSGRYAPGTVVMISAYAGTGGRVFDRWTTASTGVEFLDANSAVTVFTMPGNNVAVTATYKASDLSSTTTTATTGGGTASTTASGGSGTGGAAGSGTGTGTGTAGRTNATVEITKPGIPSHHLASASVSGSLDEFVIKISEDQAASSAVVDALIRRYGNIDNIRYFPMSISLYDATGTHKITDTTGLSISITMPLPSSQIPYGGSNRVASAEGGVLEHLSPRFSTIDGVPCISFTTTHFSPYVIYADLDNLVSGTIDDTPRTGDGIHPKWFLVTGLVCLSLILFLKKEKIPELKVT